MEAKVESAVTAEAEVCLQACRDGERLNSVARTALASGVDAAALKPKAAARVSFASLLCDELLQGRCLDSSKIEESPVSAHCVCNWRTPHLVECGVFPEPLDSDEECGCHADGGASRSRGTAENEAQLRATSWSTSSTAAMRVATAAAASASIRPGKVATTCRPEAVRTCASCGETKPRSHFSANQMSKNIGASRCMICIHVADGASRLPTNICSPPRQAARLGKRNATRAEKKRLGAAHARARHKDFLAELSEHTAALQARVRLLREQKGDPFGVCVVGMLEQMGAALDEARMLQLQEWLSHSSKFDGAISMRVWMLADARARDDDFSMRAVLDGDCGDPPEGDLLMQQAGASAAHPTKSFVPRFDLLDI